MAQFVKFTKTVEDALLRLEVAFVAESSHEYEHLKQYLQDHGDEGFKLVNGNFVLSLLIPKPPTPQSPSPELPVEPVAEVVREPEAPIPASVPVLEPEPEPVIAGIPETVLATLDDAPLTDEVE